ncbi:MAG: calcium-binding protein [Anaerolineae bacterium]
MPPRCTAASRAARWASLIALIALAAIGVASGADPATAAANAAPMAPAALAPAAIAQAACGTTVQAAVTAGTLDIVGTDAADSIRLRFDAAGQTLDVYDPVTATTPGWRLAAAGFQTIHARLCDADDRIVFDDSGGALSGRWAIRVEGEGGDDLVLGGIDVSAVSVDDAVQMIATLRTAKDMVDDALDLLDASTGPCASAPCLVDDTAGMLRAAGEDVVRRTAAYVRDIERDLVQPAAATVRDAHARIGVFAKTFVSQTATAAVAATDAITADAHAAAADFDLLLPTARGLLSDTTTLYGHAASLGLEVQSADPIGVFTRTIESQTTSIASLSRLCAEDPEPTETTSDEGQQDPSGLSPACAELERRIEALEAVTDGVGDDERPDSGAARLEAEGNAFEGRGDGLETSGEALGDDEVGTSRAAQLAAEGDALVAQGDGISADADAVGADWDAWVGQTEATLETAGGGMDARGQAEVQGAAETLRVRAGTDTADAAERLRARAAQLQADLQQLMTDAAPLFGSGGVQRAGSSTTSSTATLATLACSITPANTLSGGAGSDALIGTSGGDRIEGGDADDLIVGADGADELLGEDGNDLVFGGDGGDELKGGDKVDLLVGNGANDCLYGGGGQTLTRGQLSVDLGDLFVGGGGDDLIVSGDGTSDARTQVDLAWGGDGADEMHLSHGGDLTVGDFTFRLGNVAFGQAGDDDIETADGVDVIFGGAGDDTVRTGKGAAVDIKDSGGDSALRLPLGDLVFGDDDDDTIDADDPSVDRADDDIDVVFGGGGDDTIRGYGGGLLSIGDAADPTFEVALGNVIFGGDGEDVITTTDGVDVIFGGADGDTVQAGQGADLDIEGSDEDSTFRLALGDLIFGDDGKDTLDGDDPSADRADDDIDVVFGGGGDDTIRGYGGGLLSIGDANDPKFDLTLGNAVFGGDGDDDIACGDGIDVILGGDGDDTAQAGRGDTLEIDDDFSMQLGDVIFGQAGADTLHGDAPSAGAGADDDGIDVILGGADDDKIYGDAGGTIEVPDQDFCLLWGNVLFGGPGADLLRGDYETWDSADPHGGIDLIFGAAGADTIEGGGGSIVVIGDITTAQVVVIWFGNLLFGGPDDDTIRGANQADLSTCTNAKLDTFLNGLGVSDMGGAADLIVAGGGYDTVDAYDGIDFVFGNDGNDALHADDGGLVIVPIDEIPTPIHFGNLMFGGEGEDTITSKGRLALLTIGQPEIDLLFGGPCDDDISAGDSVNLVFGNRAADTITAGDGVNLLFGNGDDDTVTAGDGLNLAFGNGGDDTIGTGDGVSLLFGNGDDDAVTAGNGLNVLFGNGSDDAVRGGDGVSILFGNAGDDVVEGGNGLTVAFGNRGVDDVRAAGWRCSSATRATTTCAAGPVCVWRSATRATTSSRPAAA